MKSYRDMTPNERTQKKKRQRKNRGRRAAAGAELAAAVKRCWDDLPGEVKLAYVRYAKAVGAEADGG